MSKILEFLKNTFAFEDQPCDLSPERKAKIAERDEEIKKILQDWELLFPEDRKIKGPYSTYALSEKWHYSSHNY